MFLREAIYEDVPAIARVHVDTWRSTYQGIISDEYLANLSYERRANSWYQILDHAVSIGENTADACFIYVVEDECGQIVGFASGSAERTGDPVYKGELTAIYILKSHHQQGIGRRLVQIVVARLAQQGINSMLIWVLADNPACQFYAALDGQQVRKKEIEIGGRSLIEVAYGWTDTTILNPDSYKT